MIAHTIDLYFNREFKKGDLCWKGDNIFTITLINWWWYILIIKYRELLFFLKFNKTDKKSRDWYSGRQRFPVYFKMMSMVYAIIHSRPSGYTMDYMAVLINIHAIWTKGWSYWSLLSIWRYLYLLNVQKSTNNRSLYFFLHISPVSQYWKRWI